MKKSLFMLVLLLTGLLVYPQPSRGKLIPVTTNSRTALKFYSEAKKYFDDVRLDRALETFKKALDQDPDFFMANYQLASYYLLNKASDEFYEYANAAINCKAKLSEGEELLKKALVKLNQGHIDVTDIGRRLIEMYPNDPDSYNNMVSFQSLAQDTDKIVETLNQAIRISPDPAPFYNQLGYAYLTLKQNDKAEEAFDKYIELAPGNPNVYDSKGDFYMIVKKYDKAYRSYMKANSMDPSFSREKAEMARKLYEQTEGKRIDIVSV